MILDDGRITYGTDPEGFFEKGGKIIGSEKIVPTIGLFKAGAGSICQDGVQFELHPFAGASHNTLIRNTGALLGLAYNKAAKSGAEVSLRTFVTVERKELNSLKPESRVLGCMPSFNVYNTPPIGVDAATYRKRSTGGHIHVGIRAVNYSNFNIGQAIPVFDIIVGNTCVLLDRDPHAAERRENYGRAGEYRTPHYGFEYRTLSGFWLRDPAVMDFVFRLARIATNIFVQGVLNGEKKLWNDLVDVVNIKAIRKAIDTNDYTLARKNFKRLLPYLEKNLGSENRPNFEQFLTFSELVENKGLNSIFPLDQVKNRWEAHAVENFATMLNRVVA